MNSTPDRPEAASASALAGIGRGSLWLGGSTIASQLVLLIGLPLLARAYAPREFGLYTVYVGILTIAGVFVGLRYESAAVLPRRTTTAAALLWLVLASGIAAALIAAGAGFALRWTGIGAEFARHATPLAIALFATGLQKSFVAWCTRERSFALLGLGQLGAAVLTLALQLGAARWLRADGAALIWSHAAALVAAYGAGLGWSLRGRAGLLRSAWRRRRPLAVARRYRRFPLYMLPYGLSSTLRERGLQLLLALHAGTGMLGRFAVAARLTGAPNSLCYSAVAPVFFSAIVRLPAADVRRLTVRLIELSAVVLVPPFVFLGVEAPPLVDGLLGGEWTGSGALVRLLVPPMLALALTGWLDRVFDARQRQGLALGLDAAFSVTVLAGVAMALELNPDGGIAVAVLSLLSLLYYTAYAGIALHLCGLPLPRLAAIGCGCLALAVLAATVFLLPFAATLAGRCGVYGAFHVATAAVYLALPGRLAALRALAGTRRI